MLMSWVSEYARLCGAMSPIGRVILFSDLSIAVAYLMIPLAMALVLWKRFTVLPHPWLMGLFGLFITACGLTHAVHAAQMPFVMFEHTMLEASVKLACAILSVGTAAALIWLMPTLLSLQTPAQARLQMEEAVGRAVREKNELIWEINHRCGNQLQVMQSLMRLLERTPRPPEDARLIAILTEHVRKASAEHLACADKYHMEAPIRQSRVFPSSATAMDGVRLSGR